MKKRRIRLHGSLKHFRNVETDENDFCQVAAAQVEYCDAAIEFCSLRSVAWIAHRRHSINEYANEMKNRTTVTSHVGPSSGGRTMGRLKGHNCIKRGDGAWIFCIFWWHFFVVGCWAIVWPSHRTSIRAETAEKKWTQRVFRTFCIQRRRISSGRRSDWLNETQSITNRLSVVITWCTRLQRCAAIVNEQALISCGFGRARCQCWSWRAASTKAEKREKTGSTRLCTRYLLVSHHHRGRHRLL